MHEHEQACADADTSCMDLLIFFFNKLEGRLSSQNSKVKLTMNFKIKYNVHDICEVSSNYELGKFSQLDREKLFYFFSILETWAPA